MKKPFAILLLLCSFALYGCNNAKESVETQLTAEDIGQHKKISEKLVNSVYNSLSDYGKTWIASTEDGVKCYVQDHSISITIRIIAPEMIGRIADESCACLTEEISKAGYQDFSISYRYYTESNQDGMDTDSLVDWTTENGKTGTFVGDTHIKTDATIDYIYKYYDNFARNTNP